MAGPLRTGYEIQIPTHNYDARKLATKEQPVAWLNAPDGITAATDHLPTCDHGEVHIALLNGGKANFTFPGAADFPILGLVAGRARSGEDSRLTAKNMSNDTD